MVGSRPPPLGGTTILFDQLIAALGEIEDLAVDVIDSGSRGKPLSVLWRIGSALPRALRAHDVASFHASPPGMVRFGPAFVRACKRAGCPSIVRFFGGNLDRFHRDAGRVTRRRLERVLAADRVLVETEAVGHWLAEHFPATQTRIFENHRPFDRVAVRPPRTPDRTLRLIFVGEVSQDKGVGSVLDAIDRLPDIEVSLEVLGSTGATPDPLVRRLEEHPRVLLHGEIPSGEVVGRIAASDVLVLPTVHPGEGHPGAILEAYGVGRPVVTTRWRAVPEVVAHEESGLLVAPRDVDALAAAIGRLARDPALLARLSAGAVRVAEAHTTKAAAARFAAWARESAAGTDAARSEG